MRCEKGLTLIEVLISITILGIIMTSFLSFFNQAYSYTKTNEDKTVGINVARNVLYYFEQQDFKKIKENYFSHETIMEKEISTDNCRDIVNGETVFDDPTVCESFFDTKVNEVDYKSKVRFTKNILDFENPDRDKPNLQDQLIGVEITVQWGNHTADVRGLIKK
ncbi:type II secretion system protein [Robertmurraya massiliosenegalensis]|uniref:type IV pilus modification PilV family protein n=1 Tax=Robertmurraya TaxID=2837507 RepID=UPI0039A5A0C1